MTDEATDAGSGAPIWEPTAAQVELARMTNFLHLVRRSDAPGADTVVDYASLYRWSVQHRADFWRLLAVDFDVGAISATPGRGPWDDAGVGLDRMAPPDPVLGPRWFPDARLNFAANLLRYGGDRDALVSWTESGRRRAVSFAELRRQVARVAGALRSLGVGVGDRVAGFLPNVPETVIAMLAATSLGAVWSSCSPDFGVQGVIDRFGQIEPRVLFVADGYVYSGKRLDCLARAREIVARIPSIERLVVVPHLQSDPDLSALRDAVPWSDFGDVSPPPLEFARLPFDHPVYVLYSSGTTGMPKCMIHGAGGTLLQHLKELALHTGVGSSGRVFYFTTCGWMMWNWLVSSLALGATVVLYDGAALPASNPDVLWDMAAAERLTVFGTSAKYLALAEKEGLQPARTHDLDALDVILSTGSPLAAHSYDYVRRAVKPAVRLSSISGGTDIISCFALGNPIAPVWRGELQTRGLAMAVDVWDDDGRPRRGAPGELVCTAPFPSMPVAFWNDPDGSRYRAAYFEHFHGAWRHGDWAELTSHGGMLIHGRSDATLNPGGVRIGTAEIYRQVEQVEDVVESLAVEQTVGEGDSRVVLFVRLRDGLTLGDALRETLRHRIREHASPHHVPRRIVQVADIPRTISGKISEIAVREVIHGRPAKNTDALANPESLELFRGLAELEG